ncbi:MAG: hypothetical protein V4488_21645 [Pseudomonadota bacterium]
MAHASFVFCSRGAHANYTTNPPGRNVFAYAYAAFQLDGGSPLAGNKDVHHCCRHLTPDADKCLPAGFVHRKTIGMDVYQPVTGFMPG